METGMRNGRRPFCQSGLRVYKLVGGNLPHPDDLPYLCTPKQNVLLPDFHSQKRDRKRMIANKLFENETEKKLERKGCEMGRGSLPTACSCGDVWLVAFLLFARGNGAERGPCGVHSLRNAHADEWTAGVLRWHWPGFLSRLACSCARFHIDAPAPKGGLVGEPLSAHSLLPWHIADGGSLGQSAWYTFGQRMATGATADDTEFRDRTSPDEETVDRNGRISAGARRAGRGLHGHHRASSSAARICCSHGGSTSTVASFLARRSSCTPCALYI